MRALPWRAWPTLVALTAVLAACAGSNANRPEGDDAEAMYQRAMADLEDGLFPEALAAFAEVKTKHPYSKYAALADLRIADTHFERAKYLEAIDAYRQFLKLHPNHPESAYCYFRIGEAYFEQIPKDWWFLPPAAEKDQENTRRAITAFKDVLDRYPKDAYAEKARESLQEARRKLADHEMYVAQFYWKRERHLAAAQRAEGLVRDYSGLGLDAEALWLALEARKELGDTAKVREHAERLVREHPGTSQAQDAQQILEDLGAQG